MTSDFSGKTILITGAASGFGRELAERLSALGANLVLGDLNAAGLDELADNLSGKIVPVCCDVTREDDVQTLCERAKDAFGGLDIAVNNAGFAPPMKGLLETSEDDLDRAFAVNAKGVFFGMKHQIPLMKEHGGAILNVASVAGLNAAPKLISYAAAKHAVVGMTKTAAVEFARDNIRINAICPFFSPTPLMTESGFADKQDFLSSGVPMKRLGEPAEIVETMMSLIHPGNTYLTGQALAVDGGVMAL
ncbi:SDR family NAD(P)-dependent oxidoreductase [Labrenzia sp. VG12]|uniref:SDR family NAD(P)-dependent oxidoreductase n=1 Tax=Labrenzia sp. VG12 TaxID=2021862 RepID=UPI000B8BDBB6|nr:SDR family oxidoreductase [Labrenzia sp. VG12]ASP33856.1 3-oxoacyl-ACP reductase [Labrenzia sp. VG12]